MKPICLFGCPRPLGGGGTESGDTALLFRSLGIPVIILPANHEADDNPWLTRLIAAGCKISPPCNRETLPPWLHNMIVVDFAVERCVRLWPEMRKRGCHLIHCPCHCFVMEHETVAFRNNPPTAVLFQSEYQHKCLSLQYSIWGVPEDRQVLIHGAFDLASFPFAPQPHIPSTPFIVGRLARPAPAKWPPTLWPIISEARQYTNVRGDIMGWVQSLGKFSDRPPDWIVARPPATMPVQDYLAGIHVLLCLGGQGDFICPENWSRVVLEAMAAGVPVLAENAYGYREQIIHLDTGILCDTPEAFTDGIVYLAQNEQARLAIAENARKAVEAFANQQILGQAWLNLFQKFSEISQKRSCNRAKGGYNAKHGTDSPDNARSVCAPKADNP